MIQKTKQIRSVIFILFFQKMIIQKMSKSLQSLKSINLSEKLPMYKPTPYLKNRYFQSLYAIKSPYIEMKFSREKVFFPDGGHISLDWANKTQERSEKPLVVIMHGMTGGSQSKYIRAIVEKAIENNYICVCINSRGINSQMTSPIPSIGLNFHEFEQALKRIQINYPQSRLHIIGTSFGGNLVLRYFLKNYMQNVKSLSLISAPFDMKHATDHMHPLYQKFFIKRFIQNSVCKHEQMKFWWDNNIVDLEHLKQSKTIRDFHERFTAKVTESQNLDEFFENYKIKNSDIQRLNLDTFVLTAQDDPIVNFKTVPVEALRRNNKIRFMSTKKGAHLCWFEGLKNPKRWYPKPTIAFINQIQQRIKNKVL